MTPLTREQVIESLMRVRRYGDIEDSNSFEHLLDTDEALRQQLAARDYELRERAKDCIEHCQDWTNVQLKLNAANKQLAEVIKERDAAMQIPTAKLDAITLTQLDLCHQQLTEITKERDALRLRINAVDREHEELQKDKNTIVNLIEGDGALVKAQEVTARWKLKQQLEEMTKERDELDALIIKAVNERDAARKQYNACHQLHIEALEECEEKNIMMLKVRAIDAEQQLAYLQTVSTQQGERIRELEAAPQRAMDEWLDNEMKKDKAKKAQP